MSRILLPDRNCWKLVRADRLAFLIDASAFFSAVAAALTRARRSVMILAWAFDARVRLEPDVDEELGELLVRVVSERPELDVFVLVWDFTLLYSVGGEPRAIFGRSQPTHPRIHMRSDDSHPPGGSHHQKVVVVDDRLAFVGGLDLTVGRWDTPEHRAEDPLRSDPGGEPYRPFHDVQLVVSGPAAAALGELARERWFRATGERLAEPQGVRDVWPPSLPGDLEAVDVGIARTLPELGRRPEVSEIERLYRDSIEAARRWIYIESQYLTSAVVADAIARRLAEQEGPEIVVVLPRDSSGWLEQGTMDVLRTRVLRKLRHQRGGHRLRVYYPVVPNDGVRIPVYVHSKVMIIDDSLLRIGSSNISNRSMGLDTECDVALESDGNPGLELAVTGLRDRLLAEHLGVSPGRVRETIERTGSLVATVEALRGGPRTLEPLEHEPPEWLLETVPDRQVVDPERPVDLERWIDRQLPRSAKRLAGGRLVGMAVVAALACLLTAALALGPLDRQLHPERIADLLPVPEGLAGPLVVMSAYLVGSVLQIPVTLMILTTVLVYDPLPGLVYAGLGMALGATVTYELGRRLGRDLVRRVAGRRIDRISAELAGKGFLGMLTLRLLPLAPFSLVSYVAGAMGVRRGDYFLSTVVGLAPLLFGVALIADRLRAAMQSPGLLSFGSLALTVAGIAGFTFLFGRGLSRSAVGGRR